MSQQQLIERDREMIPTRLLWAMLVLVLACLGLASVAALTDRPLEAMPPNLPIAQERSIVIHAEMSGAVRVEDISGSIIAELAPEAGGFIAGVGRVLDRERSKHGLDPALPEALEGASLVPLLVGAADRAHDDRRRHIRVSARCGRRPLESARAR